MTFQPNRRALSLAASAVEMYEGGLLRLVQRCGAAKHLKLDERERVCPQWMTAWLYPNDIYVWAVLLRAAHARIDLRGDICCLDTGLTQGWLPWHTSAQLWPAHNHFTAPFSLDEYARHELAGPVSRVTHLGSNATRPKEPALQIKGLNLSAYRYSAVHPKLNLSWTRERRAGRWPRMIAPCACEQ